MNFSQKTLTDFELLRREYQRHLEQYWDDLLFRFQNTHRLSDKAMEALEERH